eukprot:CAMPEP_0181446268 /NCGR_PEP_ID=MMETSP1110-20121109/26016_1 /TAXON_ID=174948 /ORGANISM="Symbiodinium sp., Strain CCMP421" /LENGTH=440 /DNA_ID=CAMNT_0023570339 /DNA_START=77 /DNA_END=1399 /DNA_ORIENTATION=+
MGAAAEARGAGAQPDNKALSVAAPRAASRKPRIDCIDGCRFPLVFPIILGHFIRFGTDNKRLLKLLTQENVLVGGFFAISGYVAAYTSTNLGERSHDVKKLKDPELFFWQKVMGYYPLHFLVSTLGAPMFIATDRLMNNSWKTTGLHAFLNYSLLQAWFPSEAEIWNPPTWFLSSLTFANVTLPTFVLPQVASLSKDGLNKLMAALFGMSLLQKLSYSQAWKFYCRGQVSERTAHPYLWNVTRFHPFGALVEIVAGVAAARSVMLDREPQKPSMNPLWLFLVSYASLGLRLTNLLNLNDAMIRTLIFMPVYTKFLMELHRDCLSEKPHLITRFFGSKLMTWLGSLAFPMFILHGPIGQIFYKKRIAEKLWGGIMPKRFFGIYLLLVILGGHVTNEYFVKNEAIKTLSASVAQFLASRSRGFLHDAIPLRREASREMLAGA